MPCAEPSAGAGTRQCLRPEKFGFCRPTDWRPRVRRGWSEIERRREALGLPSIDWASDAPDAAQSLAALGNHPGKRRQSTASSPRLTNSTRNGARGIDELAAPVKITVEVHR